MKQKPPISTLPPDSIGEYRISRTLTPGQAYLAVGAGDRQVVIKMLEADCLLKGQLHPNIRDRLSRVRELAHRSVANLFSVERCDGKVFLVWEYIAGKSLDEHVNQLAAPGELADLAREIILTVESLHALGIVHGKIHAGNIIINELKQVKITDVSPLLHDDPATDTTDLTAMLHTMAAQRGWGDSELTQTLNETQTLKQLRKKLSMGSTAAAVELPTHQPDGGIRKKAIMGAMITLFVGTIIALGVVTVVRISSKEKPVPPEAPPDAMQVRGK